MNNYIILVALPVLLVLSCASNDESQQQKDPKLIKQINEILEGIERFPSDKILSRYPKTLISSDLTSAGNIIAQNAETRILIDNSAVSLPIMFDRFGKIPKTSGALYIYFIVFKYTKSAEAIPYITDFFAYWDDEKEVTNNDVLGTLNYALYTAKEITNINNFPDAMVAFYKKDDPEFAGKSLEIINRLKQWYEEYKKSAGQKKK